MPFDQSDQIRAGEHLPDLLPESPLPMLISWFDEAVAKKVQPNPNAMTLATASHDARPSARLVLCKEINPDPGYVVFYTNYHGRKGEELAANPHAAAVFFWDALDRQARVEGPVVKSPAWESDAYFSSRPVESRIGAWSSEQSRPIASREAMAERIAATMERLGVDLGVLLSGGEVSVPRPPHWGGFRLYAERIELWLSGTGRIHDRAVWTRALTPAEEGFTGGPWTSTRLQP